MVLLLALAIGSKSLSAEGEELTLKYCSGYLILLLVFGMLVSVEYENFGRLVVVDGGLGYALRVV